MSESATRHGFHIVYEPDGPHGSCRCGWETKLLADFMAVARAWASHAAHQLSQTNGTPRDDEESSR